MASEQAGLRRRMGREVRRISSQHRQLDSLYALVAAALERGSAAEAQLAFARFHDALEAHFSLEDELYVPALRGLRPEFDAELAGLVREHDGLRREMQSVRDEFERSDLDGGADALERFTDRLTAHEEREERLLQSIQGQPDGPLPRVDG
ncbi:MAG: hemerythrin domain-containing protein [Deltaproteobacteria bacterium]|nr:MAG: hemerythrin domain-containing protein [Deltaproteobacteria bacterium]